MIYILNKVFENRSEKSSEHFSSDKISQISVTFRTNEKPKGWKFFEEIIIEIRDQSKFFEMLIEKTEGIRSGRKTVDLNFKPTKNCGEFEYFFQEPENIRTKKMTEKHFSLALQGGGVKGTAYIGAYKAFWDYYKKANLDERVNTKSIIGSSAGGILGLAVCCELDPEDMEGLIVNYLQYVPFHDKKFSKDHSETEGRLLKSLKLYLIQENYLDEKICNLFESIIKSERIQF